MPEDIENTDKKQGPVRLSNRLITALRKEQAAEALRNPSGRATRTFAEILDLWLTERLSGPASAAAPPSHREPALSPSHAALHHKLQVILDSGDNSTIQAVVSNIEVFFDRLKPAGSTGAPLDTLAPEELRIIQGFRKSSYEKRRRILATAAKEEDLGPEVMPGAAKPERRKHG